MAGPMQGLLAAGRGGRESAARAFAAAAAQAARSHPAAAVRLADSFGKELVADVFAHGEGPLAAR